MLYAALKTLHLLAIIVWIGGMVFTLFFLRPALPQLEPPARLKLMAEVLRRFFAAVLAAAVIVLASGLWMIGRTARMLVQSGQGFQMPIDWWLMTVLGVLMVAVFGHIRFVLFPRMGRAVTGGEWPAAGAALNTIRQWVTVNLAIGVVIIVTALMM